MIGTSRSFSCEATLSDAELAALESALKLTDSSPRAYFTKAACQPMTMSKGALIRRGHKVRQPEFGGFEYIEVVLDPGAHKACFESAYSSS